LGSINHLQDYKIYETMIKMFIPKFLNNLPIATLLLEEWEDDTHTPEMGTWESTGAPKTSKLNFRGQKTLH
jgi:hypothetical protein